MQSEQAGYTPITTLGDLKDDTNSIDLETGYKTASKEEAYCDCCCFRCYPLGVVWTTVLPAAIAFTGAAGATGAGILDLTYPDSGFNVKDIAMMAGAGGAIVYPVELCLFAGLLPALAKLAKKTLPTAGVFAANASIAGALGHTLLGATGVTLGATVAAAAVGGAVLGTIIGASLELSSNK